jgi:hypothetical protein
MIEIDLFFFFFGAELNAEGQSYNYLYMTKNLDIQCRYSLHHRTLYIDKAFDKSRQLKKIVTFGEDCLFNEAYVVQESVYVLKIWNVEALVGEGYKYDGLTGGTIWTPSYVNLVKNGSERGDDEKQPFMIPILVDNKSYKDNIITAVRFSKDAALAAVAFELKDSVG